MTGPSQGDWLDHDSKRSVGLDRGEKWIAVIFGVFLGLVGLTVSFMLAEVILFWWIGHLIVGFIAGYSFYRVPEAEASWKGGSIIGIVVTLASWVMADFILFWWLPYPIIGATIGWLSREAISQRMLEQQRERMARNA